MLARTFDFEHKMRREIASMKERLAYDSVNIPLSVLEKSMLIPQDIRSPEKYPHQKTFLMENPFKGSAHKKNNKSML